MAELSPLEGRLVVVIGTNRSGTSWLRQLLLAHRGICGAAGDISQNCETGLFGSLASLWRIMLDPSGCWVAANISPGEVAPYVRRYCDALFLHAMRQSNRPHADFFVEKTPGDGLNLPWLKLIYPDAWLVRIVRDGRDVARSMRLRNYGTQSDFVNIKYWARHETLVTHYLRDVPRSVTVRYEKLACDPVRETCRIYEFLGLSAYEGLADQIAARSAIRTAMYTGEVSTGPAKWRADVSRRRLAQMYGSCWQELASYGYVQPQDLHAVKWWPEFWLGCARRRLSRYAGTMQGRCRESPWSPG